MKNRFLGVLIVALASTALFVACSDDESCLADSDCSTEGSVCENEICEAGCDIDADCAEGEICEPRAGTAAGGYCIEGAGNNGNNGTNNNGTNNNGTNNNGEATTGYVIQVIDTTPNCDVDSADPGSDLIYVSLEDDTGGILGYGSLVSENFVGDNNVNDLGENLAGTPPDFTGTCPEFGDTTVTALGCGGWAGLEFHNEGTPVQYVSGNVIRVFEFGVQCDSGTNSDEYDVILCADTNAVKNNDDFSSCTDNLGGGSGEAAFNIE